MNREVLGVLISREEYDEYIKLKNKNTPMKKINDKNRHVLCCPICKYVVDNAVPKQNYCDRCGQKLK